jgi:hypothetical protein
VPASGERLAIKTTVSSKKANEADISSFVLTYGIKYEAPLEMVYSVLLAIACSVPRDDWSFGISIQ